MWGDYGWHGGWWGMGLLSMVLYWGIIILVIVLVVRWLTGSASGAPPPARTALDVLKERYARGEIGKDEYEQKRRDLEG
jgi:putative membrane protein